MTELHQLEKRGPGRWHALDLLIIIGIGLLPRLWYWPPMLVGMDSIGFAVGGLGTWAAHPPGYFGVCFTAWLLNLGIGDIKDSLVLMNQLATVVGIVAVYRLAQWVGLSRIWTVLATISYAWSINMLYNSLAPLSYATEAMFAALTGLAVFITLHNRSQRWALIATVIWALSGFFRQTSCFVLAPLIAWMVLRAVPWRLWAVHAVLGLALSWGWMAANSYYMSAASGIRSTNSFAGSVWSTQIMMQSAYDPTSLQVNTQVEEGTGSGFHWPGVELLAWADDQAGLHALPDWRQHSPLPPSPARAFRLILNQVGKVGYFLFMSLPALALLLPAAWLAKRGRHNRTPSTTPLPGSVRAFLAVWISPALILFLFGHIGPPGYLLVFLPAWVLGLALLCQKASVPLASPDGKASSTSRPGVLAWFHGSLSALGLMYFSFAAPLQSETNSRHQLIDILALQYTGNAVKQGYNVARSQLTKPRAEWFPEWTRFTTDQEIVDWWWRNNPNSPALYPPTAGSK